MERKNAKCSQPFSLKGKISVCRNTPGFQKHSYKLPCCTGEQNQPANSLPLWFRASCQELKTPKAVVAHLTKGIDTELVYEIPKPFDHVLYLLLTFALQK